MKTAILYLERKVRLLQSRRTRKVEFLNSSTHVGQRSNIRREAEVYILDVEEQIKDLEKAIFFLNQTETNLATKDNVTIEESEQV